MIERDRILCEARFETGLERFVETYSSPEFAGAQVELWVFDGPERRAAAQDLLLKRGVRARVRSAYKPLVWAFLEEVDFSSATRIAIRYPVVHGVSERRFLLECYPVADLTNGRPVEFLPLDAVEPSRPVAYRIDLVDRDERVTSIEVRAPNALIDGPTGEKVFANTGWLRIADETEPSRDRDERFVTDMELAFETAMKAVAAHDWPAEQPYFDRLVMRIEAPFSEMRLPVEHECISTSEAMSEDVYFSTLEYFRTRNGLAAKDRSLRPGQIVPEAVANNDHVRVTVRTCASPVPQDVTEPKPRRIDELDRAERWPEPAAFSEYLAALGGERYSATSRQGRPVLGTYIEGPAPRLVITGGQHANETTGPIGALRAAQRLKDEGRTGFALSPLDNPDGYALFAELCAGAPEHMHHAARYTASGADLEYIGDTFENAIRYAGLAKSSADVHLNLHGYPAHEWTRPFTAYVPAEFELWTIPKGFAVLLVHKKGWKEKGEAVLQAIVDELAQYEPIATLTNRQLARYRQYVTDLPFEIRGGFPVIVTEREDLLFPVTIITEAPDEVIYGDAFVACHTAQMRTVMAAARAVRNWQDEEREAAETV